MKLILTAVGMIIKIGFNMNKRIEELAEQSNVYQMRVYESNGIRTLGEREEVFSKEKFAELIILECINAVMDGTKEGDHYAMQIEQHFNDGPDGILQFCAEE